MTLSLTLTAATDTGRVRARNEDSFAILPDSGVAVVADGVGGHPGGDIASRTGSDAVVDTLVARLGSIDEGPDEDLSRRLADAMSEAISGAHVQIRTQAAQQPALAGMATTVTALLIHPESGTYVIGHVGDSRAYRLRDGAIEQLTTDHTWVQEQVDRGVLTEAQAHGHPYANLLNQCLGIEQPPEPEILVGTASPGDVFLLCTDGLARLVETTELGAILEREDDAPTAIEELLSAANAAGGYDNITAVLVAAS